MNIRQDDLTGAPSRDLLALHLRGMHDHSPPGHVFALDLAGLLRPGFTVWSAWEGDAICAIGALRQWDADVGEVKSMRTHPAHLRKGAGQAMLDTIIAHARAQGLTRLCLETGSGPAFAPAIALYHRNGFVAGPAFGDYQPSAFNQFLHLGLR